MHDPAPLLFEGDQREVGDCLGDGQPARIALLTKEILAGLVSRGTGDRRTVDDTGDVLLRITTIARPGYAARGVVGSYCNFRETHISCLRRNAIRDQDQGDRYHSEDVLTDLLS